VAYFRNLSADSVDDYLAAGLSEEVSASLGRVSQLQVKSSGAVRLAQRTAGDDPQMLGRALSVRFIVEGSVRRAGERIRVSVRLVNCVNGFREWGDDYDRPTADLLAIPEDIAREVAASITGAMSVTQPRSVGVRPTSDVRAYDRYLEGNFLLAQRSAAAFTRAAAAYREAARLDPGFDRSLAKLAYTYGLMVTYEVPAPDIPRDSLVDRGLALADRVLERNPASSEAWMSRGYLLFLRHPRTLEGVAECSTGRSRSTR
jgi:TolB-like protein